MDTFAPKSDFTRHHGTVASGGPDQPEDAKLLYIGSPFRFSKRGKSGIEVSELFPHLGEWVDEMSVVRSLYTDSDNHTAGSLLMNLGRPMPGSPSLGSWMVYGLGTENQNLPAFVILPDYRFIHGPQNWSNGYLPAIYQGTLLNLVGPPIVDLKPPEGVTRGRQAANLRLINKWNRDHLRSNPVKDDLQARIRNYELAFRMQTSVPEALDLEKEPESIRELYGLNNAVTEPMGRKCLMARRMVERGVRFIQVFNSSWDSHFDLTKEHSRRGLETDRPIAGLLQDLKQRGLLDETLVVWGGEFGRTPMGEKRDSIGRNHHTDAYTMWFAGGGIRPGQTIGKTDDLGFSPGEDPVHVHDIHATILPPLGPEHTRLTFRFQGREFRLTDVAGNVVHQVLA